MTRSNITLEAVPEKSRSFGTAWSWPAERLPLDLAGLRHFKPFQTARRGAVGHFAVRAKNAAVTRAMKTIVATEPLNRAAQVSAHGAGHGKAFFLIAKDENFFIRKQRGRAERKIAGIADLESLRRLVKYAGHQEARRLITTL